MIFTLALVGSRGLAFRYMITILRWIFFDNSARSQWRVGKKFKTKAIGVPIFLSLTSFSPYVSYFLSQALAVHPLAHLPVEFPRFMNMMPVNAVFFRSLLPSRREAVP